MYQSNRSVVTLNVEADVDSSKLKEVRPGKTIC